MKKFKLKQLLNDRLCNQNETCDFSETEKIRFYNGAIVIADALDHLEDHPVVSLPNTLAVKLAKILGYHTPYQMYRDYAEPLDQNDLKEGLNEKENFSILVEDGMVTDVATDSYSYAVYVCNNKNGRSYALVDLPVSTDWFLKKYLDGMILFL